MSQPVYASSTTLIERIRTEFGRRAAGLVIALLLEAVIIGVLLTLSMGKKEEAPLATIVTTFDSASEEEPSKEPEAKPAEQKPTVQPSAQPQDQPQPDPQPVPQPVAQPPVPAPPAVISLSKNQMAQLDISNLPKAQPIVAAPEIPSASAPRPMASRCMPRNGIASPRSKNWRVISPLPTGRAGLR